MSHKIFRLFTSLLLALALSLSGVTLALAAPPANDNFASAVAILSLPFTATVDITDATHEQDEPEFCTFPDKRTVWYSFSPTENLAVQADTLGSAVTGDVTVWLASGPGFGDLNFLGCSTGSFSTNLFLEAGNTYYLQVGSATIGQAGTMQINLEQIFPPANDNFGSAVGIGSLPFTATADITNATNERDERQSCYLMDRTVWYSFTPTETMGVQVDMLGSPINANVNIYLSSGPGISDLGHALGCTANNSGSFNFIAETGKTYYLQAGFARIGQVGSIQLNLRQVSSPATDVSIDIKPGNKHNRIMIGAGGSASVQVAILSTPDFNAPQQVDKNSLTFGAIGDENSLRLRFLIGTPVCRARDVNHDRLKDLVCSFLIGKTGFKLGDTFGILKAQTVDGTLLEGRDSVVITAPSYPSYP